jgi:hypothetical protein
MTSSRDVAMTTLAFSGIDCKETLKRAMEMLGLLENDGDIPEGSVHTHIISGTQPVSDALNERGGGGGPGRGVASILELRRQDRLATLVSLQKSNDAHRLRVAKDEITQWLHSIDRRCQGYGLLKRGDDDDGLWRCDSFVEHLCLDPAKAVIKRDWKWIIGLNKTTLDSFLKKRHPARRGLDSLDAWRRSGLGAVFNAKNLKLA